MSVGHPKEKRVVDAQQHHIDHITTILLFYTRTTNKYLVCRAEAGRLARVASVSAIENSSSYISSIKLFQMMSTSGFGGFEAALVNMKGELEQQQRDL